MENNNDNHRPVASDDSFYLSDRQYLELKHRDALIANWLKVIGDKVGVPIDIGQLEKVI